MEYGAQTAGVSKGQLWTGRILSGFVAAFLVFDATIHVMKPAPVWGGLYLRDTRVRAIIPFAR